MQIFVTLLDAWSFVVKGVDWLGIVLFSIVGSEMGRRKYHAKSSKKKKKGKKPLV